ncbi:hypothetical protein N8T08_001150 [Aspergillus melleus]|uniref:Uncharacterized protein n=1 Tax=Aspergillus melleus TaxID=138277 RepID=A0ACC3ANP7_9EURO|nr:hypothetical protein N8T08_001150 [Aspergillus melleus]
MTAAETIAACGRPGMQTGFGTAHLASSLRHSSGAADEKSQTALGASWPGCLSRSARQALCRPLARHCVAHSSSLLVLMYDCNGGGSARVSLFCSSLVCDHAGAHWL